MGEGYGAQLRSFLLSLVFSAFGEFVSDRAPRVAPPPACQLTFRRLACFELQSQSPAERYIDPPPGAARVFHQSVSFNT